MPTSSTLTTVVFSGGISIEEFGSGGAGSPNVEYVRGHNYGGGVGGLEYGVRSSAPSYNVYNSRGDVVTQTNASGAVTFGAEYDAFGSILTQEGADIDRQRANTKEQDPTGLINDGFRYRDPVTGTFITRDPIGFIDGPNLYTYVHQNPWTHFDPEGLVADPINYVPRGTVTIDVDGSPRAYAPYTTHVNKAGNLVSSPQSGFHPLDREESAHRGGDLNRGIVGYVTARTPATKQEPFIPGKKDKGGDWIRRPVFGGHETAMSQGPSDPHPGYFISTTSYQNTSKQPYETSRYVDAEHVNYVVQRTGAGNLGDYVAVHDFVTNKTAMAIVGDTGHSSGGEISMALAKNLGYSQASANNSPDQSGRYAMRVFPDSGAGMWTGGSQQDIDRSAKKLKLDTDFSAEQSAYNKAHTVKPHVKRHHHKGMNS